MLLTVLRNQCSNAWEFPVPTEFTSVGRVSSFNPDLASGCGTPILKPCKLITYEVSIFSENADSEYMETI